MLRITVHEKDTELRFELEGRLAGPWVRETERCWETSAATAHGRPVVFDLKNVDYVDEAGEQLLGALSRHGAKLTACGPMMSHLVSEITGEAEPRPCLLRRSKRRLLSKLFSLL